MGTDRDELRRFGLRFRVQRQWEKVVFGKNKTKSKYLRGVFFNSIHVKTFIGKQCKNMPLKACSDQTFYLFTICHKS